MSYSQLLILLSCKSCYVTDNAEKLSVEQEDFLGIERTGEDSQKVVVLSRAPGPMTREYPNGEKKCSL